MNIGLLECDHVDERFRPIAGDYAHQILASNNRITAALKEICV